MNSKLIIAIVIIFLIIGGIIIAFYISYNKSEDKEELYKRNDYNISLRFVSNNKQISTGYLIFVNNTIQEGTSTSSDYIKIIAPQNSSTVIINKNNLQDLYYTSITKLEKYNSDITERLDIELDRVGNLDIGRDYDLGENNPINVNIIAKDYFKNIMVCVRWSTNIVSVTVLNSNNVSYQTISPPGLYYNKVDRCYNTGITLNNNSTVLKVSYKPFGNINERDYINLFIIDQDYYQNYVDIVSEFNNSDIYADNIEFKINNY